MMTPPRMIGHGEIVPDTVPVPTTNRTTGTVDKGSGHSDWGSGRHDRRSGQSPNLRSRRHKEESMGAKLMAHKEREKKYKKIVDNPMLYLEERQHQILPEEHQPEIHSLRFFGSGAE